MHKFVCRNFIFYLPSFNLFPYSYFSTVVIKEILNLPEVSVTPHLLVSETEQVATASAVITCCQELPLPSFTNDEVPLQTSDILQAFFCGNQIGTINQMSKYHYLESYVYERTCAVCMKRRCACA